MLAKKRLVNADILCQDDSTDGIFCMLKAYCAKYTKIYNKFREFREKFCLKKLTKKLEKKSFIPYNKQCCDIDSVEA